VKGLREDGVIDSDQRVLDFSRIIPIVGEMTCDTQSAAWGTKWNACNVSVATEGTGILHYHFDTAWSPPEPVISKMIEMFPELSFGLVYGEGGCDFSGILDGEDGQVTREEHGVYGDYYGERYEEEEEEEPEPVVLIKNKLGNFPHKKGAKHG